MRRLNYFLISIFLISLLGCLKNKTIRFPLNIQSEISIPGSFTLVPLDIVTPDVETNSSSTFRNNDTRADKVEEVILNDLTLTITSPESRDFSFLSSIEIFLEAEGLPEIMVASKNNVPNDSKSFELETIDDDLSEYIKKSQFEIKTKVVTDETTNSTTDIEVDMNFTVRAKII